MHAETILEQITPCKWKGQKERRKNEKDRGSDRERDRKKERQRQRKTEGQTSRQRGRLIIRRRRKGTNGRKTNESSSFTC